MSATDNTEDWITIYQSEMAARAVDRESHEQVAAVAEAWTAASREPTVPLDGGRHDGPAGRTRPDAPDGPTAVHAAPHADGDERAELRRRIAELERRLPPRP